eukprot:TRINITY_DN28507_c0_g1_i1.p1 TRINITY_DN28507_c0_g1~~TRINITY_DN28507_c0_g1_i1.p1  ORF type:complete len:623 (-),score=81.43 TRINITY_DN28507_c0_g1_i1:107-1975(-)
MLPARIVFRGSSLFVLAAIVSSVAAGIAVARVGEWPPQPSKACSFWATGDAGYQLRRLATLVYPRSFARTRDRVLPTLLASRRDLRRRQNAEGPAARNVSHTGECMPAKLVVRLLRTVASIETGIDPGTVDGPRHVGANTAFSDVGQSRHPRGLKEFLQLIREVFAAGSRILLEALASRLDIFGLAALVGRFLVAPGDSLHLREDDLIGPWLSVSSRAPSVWSHYQAELWRALRMRQPPPLTESLLFLDEHGPSDSQARLGRGVSLLAVAQAMRLTSYDWVTGGSHVGDIVDLVNQASVELSAWANQRSLDEVFDGLKGWPVVQLLADLEVDDIAELHALGALGEGEPIMRFGGFVDATRVAVIPFRDLISDHDRVFGKFHCTTDYYLLVETWADEHPEEDAIMVSMEVGCGLADCLLWASRRVSGRIRGFCLEADEMAVAAARRSVAINGLEGQIVVLHRGIIDGPAAADWICKVPRDIGIKFRPSSWELCAFRFKSGDEPAEGGWHNVEVVPRPVGWATSIDAEVGRLGLEHIDILHIAPFKNMVATLSGAVKALSISKTALISTFPEPSSVFERQMELMVESGFEELYTPKAGGKMAYSDYILARRGPAKHRVELVNSN